MPPPPDWQLPPGVSRGLWDYLHDRDQARSCDDRLAGTSLLETDLRFAECHFPQPSRLLDLGCGTGRLLVPFAGRGFDVVGVDLSEEMLAVAAAKAAAAGVRANLIRANIVELDALRDASFDYAACLFSTLGMVSGRENRCRAVGHMVRLLRPGGVLVLHVHNRWFSLWDPPGRRWLLRDLFRSSVGNPSTGDRPMPAHKGLAGLALHHFTRGEALRLLGGAGLETVEVVPVGLGPGGALPRAWWFGGLRAYGYLIAARRLR